MAPSGLHIDLNRADLFECHEVFGDAGLAGADGCDDVPSGCRTVCRQKSQNLIPGAVPERCHGVFNVRRPGVVVRLRDPWHGSILAEQHAKSKNLGLDDTLNIFDNNLKKLVLWSGSLLPRRVAPYGDAEGIRIR